MKVEINAAATLLTVVTSISTPSCGDVVPPQQ
jgi:hypothetical protein